MSTEFRDIWNDSNFPMKAVKKKNPNYTITTELLKLANFLSWLKQFWLNCRASDVQTNYWAQLHVGASCWWPVNSGGNRVANNVSTNGNDLFLDYNRIKYIWVINAKLFSSAYINQQFLSCRLTGLVYRYWFYFNFLWAFYLHLYLKQTVFTTLVNSWKGQLSVGT